MSVPGGPGAEPGPHPRELEYPVVSRDREALQEEDAVQLQAGDRAFVYPLLTEQQVLEALHGLPGWRYGRDRLERQVVFDSAGEALEFCRWLEQHAAEKDCRPRVRVHERTVEVTLTTHAAGDRVTTCDVELAEAIEAWLSV